MRDYKNDRRGYTKDFSDYAPRESRDYLPREPREQTFRRPARVRVELKKKYNDPGKNYRETLQEFKRRVSNAGLLHDFKEHQTYESKSEKKRKMRRAAKKRFLMETIEGKIIAGEKDINASAGIIKKVFANMREKELKKKEKELKRKEKEQRDKDREGIGNHHRHYDD